MVKKMRAGIWSLWKEERGVSVVLGAVLMLLIMVTLYGTVQAYHVPVWNKEVEFEHLNTVYNDMMTFKSDLEDVALSRVPKSSNIQMGVRYPNRMFLANPGPGVAGALTSENVEVSIEYTIDGLGDPTISTSHESNRIIYEVHGTVDSPKLVYEHGVIVRDYGDESATTDEQSLIVGDEIYIPVLIGDLTASSSMETESIEIKPLSQSYSRTRIKSVTITMDTDYPEVWEQLLAGTSTAYTAVEVDLEQGQVVIESTAVEQISFPAGEVTTDALYAGLVALRTESEPVTSTSIDISQDYPCVLNITIDEGGVVETQSTITVTVKNATAPFDIHADLTALTNDPQMYDVFPDYSSPDSITATSWELPNSNTVRWTNITHPVYDRGDAVIVSFWVHNAENNMQFFAEECYLLQHYFEMDIYRVVFTLLVLAYAGYSDIRNRSVSNIVWLVMAGVSITFGGYCTVVQGMSFLIPLIFSATITIAISYIFFRLGLFGAADAKALICIAVLFPSPPEFTILSHHFPLFGASVPLVFPFALIVLLNATILALAVPIFLFFRNLHSLGIKEFMRNAAMCFVAYRAKIDGLRSDRFTRLTHTYEEIDGALTIRYSLAGTPLDSDTVQRLKACHREEKVAAEIWVTPELPFILFIALGFIACCLLGV